MPTRDLPPYIPGSQVPEPDVHRQAYQIYKLYYSAKNRPNGIEDRRVLDPNIEYSLAMAINDEGRRDHRIALLLYRRQGYPGFSSDMVWWWLPSSHSDWSLLLCD